MKYLHKMVAIALVILITIPTITLAQQESTAYGLEVFSNNYISMTCTEITHDYVEFEVVSKLNNNSISVYIDSVALDGLVPPAYYGGEDYYVDLNPQETGHLRFYANINHTQHNVLSACFVVFGSDGNGMSYDIVECKLGQPAHTEYREPDKVVGYESGTLSVAYAGADENGIRLRVNNKRNINVTVSVESPFYINGIEYNEYLTVNSIPAHSVGDYYIPVMDFNFDYSPKDIESFAGNGYVYGDGFDAEWFSLSSEEPVNSANTDVPGSSPEIHDALMTNSITEECYFQTTELIQKYFSVAFEESIRNMYAGCNYGMEAYDRDALTYKQDRMEQDIRSEFAEIYSEYESENDRAVVLFGYNLSNAYYMDCCLNIMFEMMGNVYKESKKEDYENYFNTFTNNPSLEVIDQFCLYYVKNNIGDYATSLNVMSIEDIAFDISIDLDFVTMYIELATYYLGEGDAASSYASYQEGMDCLLDIMDTLDRYPEHKTSFTTSDTQEVRDMIENSVSLMRTVADDYAKKDKDALTISTLQFVLVMDKITEIVYEIGENCQMY